MNQHLGKVLIDSPAPIFIGIGQCASGDLAPDAHVVEFVLHPEQTGRDISKALAVGQLCKEQTEILVETAERANLLISLVALDAPAKLMLWQVFKQLGKDRFSCVHRSFLVEGLWNDRR